MCVCECVHSRTHFWLYVIFATYNLWESSLFTLYHFAQLHPYWGIWMTVQCPTGWLHHTLFTTFPGDTHLVCIQNFAAMTTATVEMLIHTSCWTCARVSLGRVPRSGLVGSNLLQNCDKSKGIQIQAKQRERGWLGREDSISLTWAYTQPRSTTLQFVTWGRTLSDIHCRDRNYPGTDASAMVSH